MPENRLPASLFYCNLKYLYSDSYSPCWLAPGTRKSSSQSSMRSNFGSPQLNGLAIHFGGIVESLLVVCSDNCHG